MLFMLFMLKQLNKQWQLQLLEMSILRDRLKSIKTVETIVKVASAKLYFQIPSTWSVNKLKCLLTSEIPSLDFDEFQICFKGKLQRGNYKITDIVSQGDSCQDKIFPQIELEVVKTKSQTNLSQYYRQSMQNFMMLAHYNKQPVLSTDYQRYKKWTKKPKQGENLMAENNQMNANIDLQLAQMNLFNPGNQANPLLRALRLLGFYLFIVLIYDHGKAHQIAIIASIILLYFGIQMVIKYKQKKMQNNRANRPNINNRDQKNKPNVNEHEREQENNNEMQKRRKGLFLLYLFKIVQIIFCFIFTIFPNLTVEIHLELNKQRIEEARQKINMLIPNSFPPKAGNENNNNVNANQ